MRPLRFWTYFLLLGLLSVLGLPAVLRAQSAPFLGAISPASATVGEYQEYVVNVSLTTGAGADGLPFEPYLPYLPTAPGYVANLAHDEDARNGVSLDGTVTCPDGTTLTHPGFYAQGFDGTGYPTGTAGWQWRFAGRQVGTYAYTLTATDAGGTVTSTTQHFTVTASASRGFVGVSASDPRYFATSDGRALIAAGQNDYEVTGTAYPAAARAAGATVICREFVNSSGNPSGTYLFGGFNTDGASLRDMGRAGCSYSTVAHTGRYSMYMGTPGGNGGMQYQLHGLKPATTYTFGVWVLLSGGDTSATLGVQDAASIPVSGAGWHYYTTALTPPTGQTGGNTCYVAVTQAGNAHALYVDGITLTDASGGDVLGGEGDFEQQVAPNQAAAAALDRQVDAYAALGEYLRLVVYWDKDIPLGSILADGTEGSPAPLHVEGLSTTVGQDTAVLRLERYAVRYIMARWGYSPAVMSLEFMNEGGDIGSGGMYDPAHWTGAQDFAGEVHRYTAMGRRVATTTVVGNVYSNLYPTGLYESALYPDVDTAETHRYGELNGADSEWFLPYTGAGWATARANVPPGQAGNGNTVYPTGGPPGTGWGRLDCAPGAYSAARINVPNPGSVAGQWTLSGWIRTANAATTGAAIQLHINNIANSYFNLPGGTVTAPNQPWTYYSQRFSIAPGNNAASQIILYANNSSGTVSFSGIRLTNPQGRDVVSITFDEPTLDASGASMAAYQGADIIPIGGDDYLGKPLVVSEFDVFNTSPAPKTVASWVRAHAWASAVSPLGPYQWWFADLTGSGFLRYYGYAQAWANQFNLADGTWRTASVDVSADGAGVREMLAVGQSNSRNPATDATVPATCVLLFIPPRGSGPATATVTIHGLADGAYTFTRTDLETGLAGAALRFSSTGGAAALRLYGIRAGVAGAVRPVN